MSESPKTPEQLAAEAQKKIDAQRAAAAQQISSGAKAAAPASVPSMEQVAKAGVAAGITAEALEDVVKKVLDARKVEAVQKLQPKEPDYSKINEMDIYSKDIYIPVVEHEIPDYMNVKLKDAEYVPVWANKDQRRLGALLAEGYEFVKAEHIAPDFRTPLKFDSEGLYSYQDVVCLRVHKRIRFAKLRRIQERSQQQLKPGQAQSNAKAKLMEEVILGDPALDLAFGSGKFGFYQTDTN